MSRVLAIETSSSVGSLALAVDDEILERTIATPREQTSLVLGLVDELLAQAGLELGQLDALVFGRGPGSFTGLRVAAAVVQGLSLSAGLPIVSASSLAALAQRGLHSVSGDTTPLALACIDARMGEVYCGCFRLEGGLAVAVGEEALLRPEALTVPGQAFVGLGDGFGAHAEAVATVVGAAQSIDSELKPRATELLQLAAADIAAARFVPLEAALPVYLRGSEAWQRTQ